MDHVICHFEIPADNVEALADFYTRLFGWEISVTPESSGYRSVRTSADPGAVGGGMMPRQHPMQGTINYVLVEDVAVYTERASELGGNVLVPKTEIPGMGWFAVIMDPQRNCMGLFEVLQQQ
jgi:predicted enzyme related to lactoylglutathione lyase